MIQRLLSTDGRYSQGGSRLLVFFSCVTLFLLMAFPLRAIDDINSNGKTMVAGDDKPTLTEYFGLDCPPCRKYTATAFPKVAGELVREGHINYRVQHYPLADEGSAIKAHNALQCAAEQDRFFQYKERLVHEGGILSSGEDYVTLAEELGLDDMEDFRRCVNNDRHVELIRSEKQAARDDGVRAVPTFEFKGDRWSGSRDALRQIETIAERLPDYEPPASLESAGPEVDESKVSVEIIDVSPSTSETLIPGERVEFTFRYRTDIDTKVNIWGRPRTNGSTTRGYRAHPSPRYRDESGTDTGFFYFDDETEVDEIRLQMRTVGSQQTVAEESVPVDFRWRQPEVDRPTHLDPGIGAPVQARFLAGDTLFGQLGQDIESAESSIRVYKIVYPFQEDGSWSSPDRVLARQLVDRAEEGVSVNILTSQASALGASIETAESFYESTPVEFKRDSTLEKLKFGGYDWLSTQPTSSVIYGHAVLIDGSILYLGNFVFSANDLGNPHSPGLRLTGEGIRPTVKLLEKLFAKHFDSAEPQPFQAVSVDEGAVDVDDFRMYFSTDITDRLVEMIDDAEARVDLGMYRFHPFRASAARPVLNALKRAHDRGVELHLMLGQPDRGEQSRVVQYLSKRGIPVFLHDTDEPQFHRFMVVDGENVYVGSQKFNTELTGRGYGISFTAESRKLGQQVQAYHEARMEHTERVETEESSTQRSRHYSQANDESRPERSLRWGDLTERRLPRIPDTVPRDRPILRKTIGDTAIRQAREQFQADGSQSEFRTETFGIRLDSARAHAGMDRAPMVMNHRIPNYPTLEMRRLSPLSTVSALRVDTMTRSTGEHLQQFQVGGNHLSAGDRYRTSLLVPDFNDTYGIHGRHFHRVPTSLSVFYRTATDGETWSIPGRQHTFEMSRGERGRTRLTVTPEPRGEFLGVIGFDTSGKLTYGYSQPVNQATDDPAVQIQFLEPADQFLVFRMDDARTYEDPFQTNVGLSSREMPARSGQSISLNDTPLKLETVEYNDQSDTTRIRVTYDGEEPHELLGVVFRDEEGNVLSYHHSATGGWRPEDPFYREWKLEGTVDRLEFVLREGLDLLDGGPVREVTGDTFHRRAGLSRPKPFTIEDHWLDTGPYSVEVNLRVNTRDLDSSERVMAWAQANKNRPFSLIGVGSQFVQPGDTIVRFQFEGVTRPDTTPLAIEEFQVMTSRDGHQPRTLFKNNSIDHAFSTLRLYDGDRPDDTGLNDLSIRSVDTDRQRPRVNVDVEYRSGHGQNIVIMAIPGSYDGGLSLRSSGWFGFKHLLQKDGTLRIPLQYVGQWGSFPGGFDADTLTVVMFRLDDIPSDRPAGGLSTVNPPVLARDQIQLK